MNCFFLLIKNYNKNSLNPEWNRLTQEINRLNNPGISKSVLKMLTNSGTLTKRYSSQASASIQLKETIGASLGVAGSTYGETIHSLAIGIYEDLGNEG